MKEMWQWASVRPGNSVNLGAVDDPGHRAQRLLLMGDRVTAAMRAPSTVTVPRNGAAPLASMIETLQ